MLSVRRIARLSTGTRPRPSRAAWTKACSESEIADNARKVVKVAEKEIIVAKQQGKLYAFNSKCPHLNMPLNTSPIRVEAGTCLIECKFHKSKFDCSNGDVLVWSESVMGIPGTKIVGSLLGNINKGKKLDTYTVKVEDGSILVDI